MTEKEDLQNRIETVAKDLIEHCESVIVLASWSDEEFDTCLYSYRGNYHTVLGLMEDFKIKKSTSHLEKDLA